MSVWEWVQHQLFGGMFTRLERLETMAKEQVDEITGIKAAVLAYQDAVTQKVADLEATIAANGGGNADVQAALDDLKKATDTLKVPA